MNKIFFALMTNLIFINNSFPENIHYSKYPFITLRSNMSENSRALKTVTCHTKIKVQEVKDGWASVKMGKLRGFVKEHMITKNGVECLSKKEKLVFNSLSLSAEEIYFWAKLGEHAIEGELNEGI
tara:strand:+ start:483 stop:857 length:375 start_codon:yes stop_codon:yes gene_type:complete